MDDGTALRLVPQAFLNAMRAPATWPAKRRAGQWVIKRVKVSDAAAEALVGYDTQTILSTATLPTLHRRNGEIVMEDSLVELRRHLPIVLGARGRVLVTGLGLGCVVRGLLCNRRVDHVTVIEIDRAIIRLVGPEFAGNPRVKIVHADAFQYEPVAGEMFDFAWHDIWTDKEGKLQLLHAALAARFAPHVRVAQGAWGMPRQYKRLLRRSVKWIG